jgi:hypothetical protein
MSDVPTTIPKPREPKLRKPPPRVRDAIHAYVSGRAKTKTAAAKIAGISREYFERSLSQPHVSEYLRARALREVATSAGRAAARLNQLIDSGSERVAFEATRFSLGVAGIKPVPDNNVSVNVGIELKAGYVIDLSESGDFSGVQALANARGEPVRVIDLSVPGNSPDAIKTIEPIAGIGPDRRKPAE